VRPGAAPRGGMPAPRIGGAVPPADRMVEPRPASAEAGPGILPSEGDADVPPPARSTGGG